MKGRWSDPPPLCFADRSGGYFGMHHLLQLWRDARAATAIEYGLIAALIAVAAITAMGGVGNKLKTTFSNVSNKL
jgi:pilus assembly protein Flp/PilA